MNKLLICQEILEEMKQRIYSPYLDSFRLGNHFTRNRKLDKTQVIFYLLYLSKASMNLNIANIRDDICNIKFPDVTKQAISKARKGISSDLFKDLFHFSVNKFISSYQQRKTWNGFYPYAIDGSCIQVPKSKDNVEYFGLCKNQHHSREDAMARISILYDLLEDIVVDGSINDYKHAERRSAKKHLDYLESAGLTNRALLLFDRGYPSYEFFKRIHQKGYSYVMRIQNTVKALTMQDNNDEIVSYVPAQLKREEADPVQVRVIHVTLEDGTDECLVTNIMDPVITPAMLKELYFLRWGIESKYNELKNQLKLEEFSGARHQSVKQDFYINLLFMNLCSLIKSEADTNIAEVTKNKNNKYKYQANRAFIIGRVKKYLILMLCGAKHIADALKQILQESIKRRSQIQPNRKCKRQRMQLRYRHLNNRKTCM
jgi:hypothetical protein